MTKVPAAGLTGTEGYIVCVEADVGNGIPGINMIGSLSSSVRESADRVRTAVRNSGISLFSQKVTVNLSPADIKKEGTAYDMAIAAAMLGSYEIIKGEYARKLISESVFIGELSLGGQFRPVPGVLSLASAAKNENFGNIFVPEENAVEAAVIPGIRSYGIRDLNQLVGILNGETGLPPAASYMEPEKEKMFFPDFSDIKGQEMVKRATVIAVAGRHNILYIGPAGSGKSMLASRIPGIMPRMTESERLEISKIYSVAGLSSPRYPLLSERPFRNPHHTISPQALSGGGSIPKPGEISLASHGVLFLDEFAEFKSGTIESLRQPMEDKKITVSRIRGSVTYKTDFILCAATNPCKCGFYPDRTKCSCSEIQVRNYLGKISKPILDRIDICVETVSPRYKDLKEGEGGRTSEALRNEVERVREIQMNRFRDKGILYNSEMDPRLIKRFCVLSEEDNSFLSAFYERKGISARGLNKILKVARTIADLEGNEDITHDDLCEAISYRSLETKYWGGNVYG